MAEDRAVYFVVCRPKILNTICIYNNVSFRFLLNILNQIFIKIKTVKQFSENSCMMCLIFKLGLSMMLPVAKIQLKISAKSSPECK